MYNMNREVAFKTVDSSWKDLYAKVMTSYVLDDEKSPGVIDDEEAKIVGGYCEKRQGLSMKLNTICLPTLRHM